ncbi:MAG: thiamine pyrophosphate-binding protein, partial [Candidatus Bathyarchaeia archaeon]
MTGADVLVAELKRQGVAWVATLCGNGLNPFYVACRRAGLQLIDTHNEQAAAYMADAYGRLTGQVGICAVSSGVAHLNALTGVANAFFDGAPLLLITGASAGYGAGRGVFQEMDQVALAAPLCKFATWVSRVSDLPFLVRQAFAAALSGRPGPVHLTIPIDILESQVDEPKKVTMRPIMETAPLERMDPRVVSEAAKVIGRAQRPLLIAGSGVFYAGGQAAMMRFSEVSAIPIVTPIWDRGAVESPHPNFLGVVGAASGEPRLLADADLIILAGARVDYRVGFLTPPAVREDAFIIRIDRDVHELRQGIEPDLALPISPASALDQLAAEMHRLGQPPHIEWLKEAQERWRLFRARWVERPAPAGRPMTGRHIVDAIRPLLTEDVVFLIDGGNIGQWVHMALADHYPSRWLTCGASAVVGWGIPGAMAAKLAYPDRPVLLLSGDGAFGFTVTELESAVRQGLPFVAVVANDEAWGIVVSGQRKAYGEEGVIASRLGAIRFDRVAEALGANGLRIEKPEDLAPAIRRG